MVRSHRKCGLRPSRQVGDVDAQRVNRIAVRIHNYIPGSDGGADVYANRAVLFLETRWGRLVRWEDYEDTERIATWDATADR